MLSRASDPLVGAVRGSSLHDTAARAATIQIAFLSKARRHASLCIYGIGPAPCMGKLGKRKGRLRATDSVDPLAARLAWRVTLAVAPQLCDTAFGRLCSDQQRENGKTAGSRS